MQIPLDSFFALEFIKDIDWDTRVVRRHPGWKTPDRVDDLADWKFLLRRPLRLATSPGDRSKDIELNGHNWEEVEVFLMQKEFDVYLEGLR